MPIYEYLCRGCGAEFEAWVRKPDEKPACPECNGSELERKLSLPRLHTSGTHDLAMRAAKKRDAAQAKEAAYTQRQYELNHDD